MFALCSWLWINGAGFPKCFTISRLSSALNYPSISSSFPSWLIAYLYSWISGPASTFTVYSPQCWALFFSQALWGGSSLGTRYLGIGITSNLHCPYCRGLQLRFYVFGMCKGVCWVEHIGPVYYLFRNENLRSCLTWRNEQSGDSKLIFQSGPSGLFGGV